jgi:dUTPase
MNIRIINKTSHQLPAYETAASAGMDIRANLIGSDNFETDGAEANSERFVY